MREEKIYLETVVAEFNCSARNLDESLFIEYFQKNHCSIVKDPQIADVILVNTCAAYKKCVDYSIEMAKKRKMLNKKLIVCGCLPGVNPQLLKEQVGMDVFCFSPKNMDLIDEIFPHFEFKLRDIKDANDIKPEDKIDKETGFIRIAKGCLGSCSYCAIKEAIGRLKSKPIEVIEEEFKCLTKKYKRIVLVSEDIGAYGIDVGKTLPELIRRLITLSGKDTTIYFASLNASWFVKYKDELLDIFKSDNIEKSFGIALQSGSNRILELMKRYNKMEEIESAVIELKRAVPNIVLSSCFIIGFPTETDEDFMKSLDVMKKKYFNYLGIFKYYETGNMDSIDLLPKVDAGVIEKRVEIVSELLNNNKTQFRIG